jgi:hypothetical protein
MPYKNPTSLTAKISHTKRQHKYYDLNRDAILLNNKLSPARLKSSRINNWKRRGVNGDLHILYEKYLTTDRCEKCLIIFENTKDKCLDHDHETNEFRFILCRNCNNDIKFKSKSINLNL